MEFLPFLRCRVEKATMGPGYLISFKLADGSTGNAIVHGDFIFDRRLCRVKMHKALRDRAIIILPAPVLGKGCAVEILKDSLEWHR